MDFVPHLYALYMASIDAVSFSLLKARHIGLIKGIWMFPITMLIYATQPLVFYNTLSVESMTVMNVLWNVMSNVVVTLIGLLFFKEQISKYQYAGIIVCIFGITLLGMH